MIDDEIEIIKDILPATISSELLSVVSNDSKEVLGGEDRDL